MSTSISHAMPNQPLHDELDRHAYNAAFHELGLRWHWDAATYGQLQARSGVAAERVRHYLETAQAHMLTAYDADFLVEAIEARQARHRQAGAAVGNGVGKGVGTPWVPTCNWAAIQAGQVGA